ncbi:MAG: prohibitin family protein [Alphaproteobacteria bacterium]|nr:prohibitin family protein [Alphaproteobacteria bacterium]
MVRVAKINRDNEDLGAVTSKKSNYKFWLLGIIVCCFAYSSIKVIDTGYRGIKTRFGKVIGEALPEGIYVYNPITTDIHMMDTKVQKYTVKMATYTKDVQQAELLISVNTSLVPSKVHLLFQNVGFDYGYKIIAPQVSAAVKDTIGKWEADVLVSNREKATSEIYDSLKEAVLPYNIDVQSVIIENIDYSAQFERAIEQKQIATQDAIRAKNRTKQVEEEANQKVLAAKAEAESMRIRSQALSQNQNLVAYEAVQKWDGRLPVNMYGSAPIPFIDGALSGR